MNTPESIIHPLHAPFVAFGISVGLFIGFRLARQMGISRVLAAESALTVFFSGALGARLFYVLTCFSHFSRSLADVFKIWQGDLIFFGGIFGAMTAMIIHLRVRGLSFWKFGDLWALAAAAGLAIGKAGNLGSSVSTLVARGSIFYSGLPDAIPFHQLIAVLVGVVIFLGLMVLHRCRKFDGQVLLWYLILYSTGRLFLERFMGAKAVFIPGTQMTITQATATVTLLVSVGILLLRRSRWEKSKGLAPRKKGQR